MNYTVETDIKKEISSEEAQTYIKGEIKEIIHEGSIWNIISCTKDVLPLDNPPKTYNLRIKRLNGYTFANYKEDSLMQRFKDAEDFLVNNGVNPNTRVVCESKELINNQIRVRDLLVKYTIESEIKAL